MNEGLCSSQKNPPLFLCWLDSVDTTGSEIQLAELKAQIADSRHSDHRVNYASAGYSDFSCDYCSTPLPVLFGAQLVPITDHQSSSELIKILSREDSHQGATNAAAFWWSCLFKRIWACPAVFCSLSIPLPLSLLGQETPLLPASCSYLDPFSVLHQATGPGSIHMCFSLHVHPPTSASDRNREE